MKSIPYVDFRNQVFIMNIQLNKASILGLLLMLSGGLLAQVSTHTVKKKETLYGISKKYGITVTELKTWNKLSGNTIKIGQKLKVGETVPKIGTELSTYDVALMGLDRGKMSVDEAAQKLSLLKDLQREQVLKKGQTETAEFNSFGGNEDFGFEAADNMRLRGENPQNFIYYRVKAGDDLFSIADNFEVSVDDLQFWNNIQGVRVDDVIIVQNGSPAAEARVPGGVSRSQNLSRLPAQPVWFDPVEQSQFNPNPGVESFNRGMAGLTSFSFDEVQGGEIIYSRNMNRPDTDVRPFQTSPITRGGQDPFPPLVQPEGPMVVLPNPASNQVRESGGYGVFSIPGYKHFRFYGAHKVLPVGSKVHVDIPNNPGHVEVTIVQQLPPNSPYVIGLSPSVVNLLKSSSGSNAQVSIMY